MNFTDFSALSQLSDHELVAGFSDTVIDENEWLARHLGHIAELDRRRLFYHHDCLRTFLVCEYRMDEGVAGHRIRAARMIRRFPFVLEKIGAGKLNVALLELAQGCAYREKLSDEELGIVLEALSGLSTRAAKRELAARYPKSADELPKERITPLTDGLSEVRFVATDECLEKLEEVRGLLARSSTQWSLGELMDHIVTDYLERHHPVEKARRTESRAEKRAEKRAEENKERAEKEVHAESAEQETEILQPRAASLTSESGAQVMGVTGGGREKRFFSVSQEHALVLRDGYQCSYFDQATKKHCSSTYNLQKDHVHEWALGGKTELSNARCLCAQHHRRISFLRFGEGSKYFKPK